MNIKSNEMLYPGKKVYGPYTRKDGRQVVILKTPGSHMDHQTMSYPKYLVETTLGRHIQPDEQIDHIDGDFTNNSLSNLRIIPHPEHARSHVLERLPETYICPICGSEYQISGKDGFRKTCSKRCAGLLSHDPELSASIFPKPPRYRSRRTQVDSIKSIAEILDN